MMENPGNIYARKWDDYVESWTQQNESNGGKYMWPGDEWADPESWQRLFRELFVPSGVAEWEKAIEIGPGSGKYSIKVMENSSTLVRVYDVSARFLQVCEQRCEVFIRNGRLSLRQLMGEKSSELLEDIIDIGWKRKVDACFSIDSMVHVDLQYLIVYLITAGLVLKPGGRLIMTLADVSREAGFRRMLEDISWTYRHQGEPTGKFEWLCPEMVGYLLGRLGFSINYLGDTERDMHLIAELRDPELADSHLEYLMKPVSW
jgi:hypothetical protein